MKSGIYKISGNYINSQMHGISAHSIEIKVPFRASFLIKVFRDKRIFSSKSKNHPRNPEVNHDSENVIGSCNKWSGCDSGIDFIFVQE
jgi:hypothetical protein